MYVCLYLHLSVWMYRDIIVHTYSRSVWVLYSVYIYTNCVYMHTYMWVLMVYISLHNTLVCSVFMTVMECYASYLFSRHSGPQLQEMYLALVAKPCSLCTSTAHDWSWWGCKSWHLLLTPLWNLGLDPRFLWERPALTKTSVREVSKYEPWVGFLYCRPCYCPFFGTIKWNYWVELFTP